MKINYKIVYKNKTINGSFSTNIITRINATRNRVMSLLRDWLGHHGFDSICIGAVEVVVEDKDAASEFKHVGVFNLENDIDLVFEDEVPA